MSLTRLAAAMARAALPEPLRQAFDVATAYVEAKAEQRRRVRETAIETRARHDMEDAQHAERMARVRGKDGR